MSDMKEQAQVPADNTLGVLEEDDEFEEFAVAGQLHPFFSKKTPAKSRWNKIGMIRKQTWHILEVLPLVQQNPGVISCGRIIGMTMI